MIKMTQKNELCVFHFFLCGNPKILGVKTFMPFILRHFNFVIYALLITKGFCDILMVYVELNKFHCLKKQLYKEFLNQKENLKL